jgi:hypothetical protein
MADKEHLGILRQGVRQWNAWRKQNPELLPDLTRADLSGVYLRGANLGRVDLSAANLSGAELRMANLHWADLSRANLSDANLQWAELRQADLTGANLTGANLFGANLGKANPLWNALVITMVPALLMVFGLAELVVESLVQEVPAVQRFVLYLVWFPVVVVAAYLVLASASGEDHGVDYDGFYGLPVGQLYEGDLTEEVLKNGSYVVPDLGVVHLSGGSYEDSYVSDAIMVNKVGYLQAAFGDLNKDGIKDAAVGLWGNTGGSATFIYLIAVTTRSAGLMQAGQVPLGERVRVKSLAIDRGRIVVETLGFGPQDPQCCPSMHVTRTFTLVGRGLKEVNMEGLLRRRMEDLILALPFERRLALLGVAFFFLGVVIRIEGNLCLGETFRTERDRIKARRKRDLLNLLGGLLMGLAVLSWVVTVIVLIAQHID